jgi:hypothetical protein
MVCIFKVDQKVLALSRLVTGFSILIVIVITQITANSVLKVTIPFLAYGKLVQSLPLVPDHQ